MICNRTLSLVMATMFSLNLLAAPVVAQPKKKGDNTQKLLIEEARKKALEGKNLFGEAKALDEAGQKAAAYTKYNEAAQAFLAANRKSHEPTTLFNAAKAYMMGREFHKAIELFEEYLAFSSDEEGKKEAREHIIGMKAEIGKPLPAGPNDMGPPKSVEKSGIPDPTISSRPAEKPSRVLMWTGFGTGAILGIASGVQLWRAESAITQAKNMNLAPDGSEEKFTAKGKEASDMRTSSVVMGGAAVLFLGYGLFQLFTEPQEKPDEVKVVPMAGPGIAGISVGGTFGKK